MVLTSVVRDMSAQAHDHKHVDNLMGRLKVGTQLVTGAITSLCKQPSASFEFPLTCLAT